MIMNAEFKKLGRDPLIISSEKGCFVSFGCSYNGERINGLPEYVCGKSFTKTVDALDKHRDLVEDFVNGLQLEPYKHNLLLSLIQLYAQSLEEYTREEVQEEINGCSLSPLSEGQAHTADTHP